MSDVNTDEMDHRIACKKLDIAIAARAQEIDLFWKRSLFFWGFISVAFLGYAKFKEADSGLAISMACFGLVCAFLWTLLNRGSKYWQESWEQKVTCYEEAVTGELFAKREDVLKKGVWLGARKFSVSKITIALSDYVAILWAVVLFYELTILFGANDGEANKNSAILIFTLFTLNYILATFLCAKTFFPKKFEGREFHETMKQVLVWLGMIVIDIAVLLFLWCRGLFPLSG